MVVSPLCRPTDGHAVGQSVGGLVGVRLVRGAHAVGGRRSSVGI